MATEYINLKSSMQEIVPKFSFQKEFKKKGWPDSRPRRFCKLETEALHFSGNENLFFHI